MSIGQQVERLGHLTLVPAGKDAGEKAGQVLILGPLPPLIGTAASHTSALLHMFKEAGYGVRSATGPGLAMARHALNFASETRLRNSTSFLADCVDDDIAVLYARSFDFSKTAKPFWYKRRLEELRKLRVLWRVVGTFRETALLFDRAPFLSRYQLSLWATAWLAGVVKGRKVHFLRQTAPVEEVFETLTGLARTPPSAFRAEESAYDAAFADNEAAFKIRLTIARAEQALSFWEGRGGDARVVSDLKLLVAVAKKFDLNALAPFRLLWSATQGRFLNCDQRRDHRALRESNALIEDKLRFGVPITKYMRHLWMTVGPNKTFRVNTQKDAERVLDWYLLEAPGRVAAGCVPIPGPVRDYFFARTAAALVSRKAKGADVSYALGRDQRPFALSPELAALASEAGPFSDQYSVDDPVDRVGFVFEYLSSFRSSGGVEPEIGHSARTFFSAPIGDDARNVSRLEFLLALQGRCQLGAREEVETPWSADAVRSYAANQGRVLFPGMRSLLPKPVLPPRNNRMIAVSGLPKSETGVGSNLHMSVGALRTIGFNPAVYDTADGMRALPQNDSLRGALKPRQSFALHHVNADQIPQTLMTPSLMSTRNVINAGFLLWEFDVLPASHRLALEVLDEIWTPSSFLADVYAAHTTKPVINMRKGLHVPEVSDFDLAALGVPAGCMTFLTCFDFHSSVARKNPLAAVQAFVNAFAPEKKDVNLIVKTTPAVKSHWGDPEAQMHKIRELASRDDRIKLVEGYFSFNALLGLIAKCDCLISPHRAEGFGLMPAYALGLGRAVIATDYSGTSDFCTTETAFPIEYEVRPANSQHVVHPIKGATWAEINGDALAHTMRAFARDPAEGLSRARAGRALIESLYAPHKQAERYKRRLTELGVI